MKQISEKEIELNRKEIDKQDKIIVDAFLKRMEAVLGISRVKHEKGLPLYDRVREESVISARTELADSARMKAAVKKLFTCLMDISREEQRNTFKIDEKKPAVAYQGIPGAYSHQAAFRYFRENFEGLPQKSFQDVFTALSSGEAQYGVLPLENSSTGSIVDVYDLMIKYGCYIAGEEIVEVNHCLLGVEESEIKDIKSVYSHEQGFQQCMAFLGKYPEWEKHPYYNTAMSAEFVSSLNDKTKAAIASRDAAEFYGLKVLAEDIQSIEVNYTRFIVVAPKLRRDNNCNKVSLCFIIKNESGSLSNVISLFAEYGLNLLKLESRPIAGQPWHYRFFADIQASLDSRELQDAISRMGQFSSEWRILGNYPSAVNAVQP